MGSTRAPSSARQVAPRATSRVTVPLQGAEVAVRCAVRAELDHAPELASLRRGRSLVQTLRSRAADTFRLSILHEVSGAPARIAVVRTQPPQEPHEVTEAERATSQAVLSDARIIIGPVLPGDHRGHRSSQPDLLVRWDWSPGSAPVWLPVVVKHHRLTRAQGSRSDGWTTSLDDLDPAHARPATDVSFRSGPLGDDALRLAHHWRAMEAHGLTPAGVDPAGWVIDKDRSAWWIPLDEPRWIDGCSSSPISALERYDQRFSLRLDAIAARLARNEDPNLERRVSPVRISECDECPWHEVCKVELEAADHVSLVPGFRYNHAVEHLRRGVTTRADLAQLDWRTAAVAFGSSSSAELIDLVELRDEVSTEPPTRTVQDALGPDHPALGRLRDHDVHTVADLLDLDPRTASYSGAPVGHLPTAIDQARAATRGQVFRARDCSSVLVPRADVEVDVDMENVEAGVYLWGTYTTRRSGASGAADLDAIEDGYLPFVSWDPIDDDGAATVFAGFWRWLTDVRRRTLASGLTFAAYCYTSAEHEKMRQILAANPDRTDLPSPAEVDQLVSSPQWVDLYQVVRRSIVTGARLGLKKVAPLSGFSWRDPDPGGEQSMYWHERAVAGPDPQVRSDHRRRILTYNEDDVLATLALRTWLTETDLPHIEDWRADGS